MLAMRPLAWTALLTLSLTLSGCLPAGRLAVTGSGTVHFVDLEGGFFGLVADDGTRYLPLNLPPAFRVDGLRVRFRGRPRPEVVTVTQWGTPLELLEIGRLEGS